ncbi:YsnF/AvaK domain-containing protein [Clostridium felsineum]|uniref:YsnF/AvaK domain-containing protein n=1 Tax=Clostridium felsineum TaxID=36839 RepID=UPI00098C6B01|nr:YsnF/AvaK domain-containing protein [Clostridium felsineum]URZ17459.1 Stress response protein YsnF [Clostridium felsineum DSM 794]
MKSSDQNKTLKLKAEELDIAKQWIKTGDVKIYKETLSTEKSFTIPVKREELVIEKKSYDTNSSEDIIRIPLSEEQVSFSTHRVTLEDVSIYKNEIEEIKHIESTLKKEEPKVKTSGDITVLKD